MFLMVAEILAVKIYIIEFDELLIDKLIKNIVLLHYFYLFSESFYFPPAFPKYFILYSGKSNSI